MSTWRAFVETLHIIVLGLWLGLLIAVGAAAAVMFPAMKALNVRIADLPGDGTYHYRIAAGRVAEKVFLIGDAIMFPCALIAIVTLAILIIIHRLPVARPATILRVIALAVALASFASLLFIVTPGINKAAQGHLAAAKADDPAATEKHMRASDDLHPIATNLMAAEAVGVFLALVCGAWSLARPSTRRSEAVAPSRYEEPALLNKSRRN